MKGQARRRRGVQPAPSMAKVRSARSLCTIGRGRRGARVRCGAWLRLGEGRAAWGNGAAPQPHEQRGDEAREAREESGGEREDTQPRGDKLSCFGQIGALVSRR
eukprot:6210499-Pleurochrysis_carterae.AAC.1